jgi:hypothetical protein
MISLLEFRFLPVTDLQRRMDFLGRDKAIASSYQQLISVVTGSL